MFYWMMTFSNETNITITDASIPVRVDHLDLDNF